MKIKLTVQERAYALIVPGQVRGNFNEIRKALQALEALDFTEEEIEEYGIAVAPRGAMTWAPETHDVETTVEMKAPNLRWLIKKAKDFSNWPAHPSVISMFEKLEAAKKGVDEE